MPRGSIDLRRYGNVNVVDGGTASWARSARTTSWTRRWPRCSACGTEAVRERHVHREGVVGLVQQTGRLAGRVRRAALHRRSTAPRHVLRPHHCRRSRQPALRGGHARPAALGLRGGPALHRPAVDGHLRDGALPLRDGANRDVISTRYVLLDSTELVRRRVEYVTLWDAVASLRLPPEHEETIPLEVPAPAGDGLPEGLETIAGHVPGTVGDSDRRRAAAVHWAVAVAALLLQSGPVVITGGGALDARARLAVFDAIAGLLPYGVRGGLAVGSCVDGGDEPPTHLAFGPAHTPSARCVELGTLPQVPAGAPEEYRRQLLRLIEVLGLDAVTAGLRAFDAAVAPADPGPSWASSTGSTPSAPRCTPWRPGSSPCSW
ncbi:hypothetical protein ACR6C2_06150 [Streptomyces sp. INA 01156]